MNLEDPADGFEEVPPAATGFSAESLPRSLKQPHPATSSPPRSSPTKTTPLTGNLKPPQKPPQLSDWFQEIQTKVHTTASDLSHKVSHLLYQWQQQGHGAMVPGSTGRSASPSGGGANKLEGSQEIWLLGVCYPPTTLATSDTVATNDTLATHGALTQHDILARVPPTDVSPKLSEIRSLSEMELQQVSHGVPSGNVGTLSGGAAVDVASTNLPHVTATTPVPLTVIVASRYQLLSDFRSRIWMTYRHHFPAIEPSSLTSDIGWGCMLRSGQSMLAQAILFHLLGRDWRFGMRGDQDRIWSQYVQLLTWFLDDPRCPFSVHRMATLGTRFQVQVGDWFGPTTIAQVIRTLLDEHSRCDEALFQPSLVCYQATDGTIYHQEVLSVVKRATLEEEWDRALLVLVPTRLGVEHLNPVYYSAIQYPQSLGIAGGKPNSALYFVGVEGNHLLYLDPHISKPTVRREETMSLEDTMSYHCDQIRSIEIGHIDPSLLFGFLCKSKASYLDLCRRLEEFAKGNTSVVLVAEEAPKYDDDLDIATEDEAGELE